MGKLLPIAIKAIQDLSKQVIDLQNKLSILENNC
jgi:hypothetical protein